MLSPGNALGAENMIVNIIKKSLSIRWVSHKIVKTYTWVVKDYLKN